jgi:hypothetical protein
MGKEAQRPKPLRTATATTIRPFPNDIGYVPVPFSCTKVEYVREP